MPAATNLRPVLADTATLTAILTSLGIGGLIGAWATAWHERTEKFRDLTIEACVRFLQKHEVAQRELDASQVALLGSATDAPPVDAGAVLMPLTKARGAWRDLQAQAFRLAILFRGGGDAPAARDARAVVILYSRWLQALGDFAAGHVDVAATEEIATAYSGYAIEHYNEFAKHANDAIRGRRFQTLRGRYRRRDGPNDFEDRLHDLDEYAEWVRSGAPPGEGQVDPKAAGS